jgi:hypothetical protein
VPAGLALSGISVSANANNYTVALKGTPTTLGSGTATITAEDAALDTASVTFNWSVMGPPPPTDPVTVQPIPAQAFTVGTKVTIKVQASQATNRSLGYTVTGLPDGSSIPGGASGMPFITGIPDGSPTSGIATVRVNDPSTTSSM